MKTMKKLLAALLVLTMVVALASTAFAYKEKEADKYVKFTGSAWGYDKVTNQHGKNNDGQSKGTIALRKGSIAHVVGVKGKWLKIEVPTRGMKDVEFFWFNEKYTKATDSEEVKLIYSAGGSGRSTPEGEEEEIAAKYKKVTVKSGRRTNIRKTASLAGKSLGVIGKGHGTKTVKLHKDHMKVADSRGIFFYHIMYKGKAAWVSSEYTTLKK